MEPDRSSTKIARVRPLVFSTGPVLMTGVDDLIWPVSRAYGIFGEHTSWSVVASPPVSAGGVVLLMVGVKMSCDW